MLFCLIVIVLMFVLLIVVVVVGVVFVKIGFVYGLCLEGFDYLVLVKFFKFELQGNVLEMVYLDVVFKQFNGQVVVLLYGKNFCVVIWEGMIVVFIGVGYCVIVFDQIGFCKLSKLCVYQYMFQ